MPRVLSIALALFLSASAWAADEVDNRALKETAGQTGWPEADIRAALGQCDKDTWHIDVCAEYGFIKADQKLRDLYQAQLSRLRKTPSERKFVAAERAWIKFRDTDCEYQASGVEGGTMQAGWILGCKRERTEERAKHIQSYLDCTDNGCPGE